MKSNLIIKSLAITALLFLSVSVMAVPAKRGMWRTITLKNGKQVKVELVGDERFHFYRDSLGNAYVQKIDNSYVKKSQRQLKRMQKKAMKRYVNLNGRRR